MRRSSFSKSYPLRSNFAIAIAFSLYKTKFIKEIKSAVGELQASEHLSLEFQDRPQDIWLGHSYFFKKPDSDFRLRVQYEIVPILQEYLKAGLRAPLQEF